MSCADVPEAKKAGNRKVLIIVFSILGAFVLLSGGCIALLVKAGTAGYGDAKIGAEKFLTPLEKHDFDPTRGAMTDAAEAATTKESLENIVAVTEKRRGKMLRHEGPVNWRENSFNGVTTVQLTYTEIFEHGQTTVNLTMLGDSGSFKTQNFQFAF